MNNFWGWLYKTAFDFDGKIYKETNGLAMCLPLGTSLANAFSCFHEQIWLNDFPEDLSLYITEDM